MIAAYDAALAPADPDVVLLIVTRLALHFWADPNRPVGHWEAVLEDYVDDLARYPVDLVAAGAVEWRRGGKPFFPKISELVALIAPAARARAQDAGFLHELRAARTPAPAVDRGDPGELAEIMARARASLGPPIDSPGGATVARRAPAIPMPETVREAIFDAWGQGGGSRRAPKGNELESHSTHTAPKSDAREGEA